MQNFNKILLGFIAIVAVGMAFFYAYKSFHGIRGTDLGSGNSVEVGGQGKFTIEKVDVPEGIKEPSLDRPIVFVADIPADARVLMTKKINDLVVLLKKDPRSLLNWLKLGLDRKITGDYVGATEAWEYVASLAPSDPVAFANLGEVYQYYLKDYPKAEKNMLAAVRLKPDYIAGYRALYDLYTLSYKEKVLEAPKVLLRGLAANPHAAELMIVLAEYYKGAGNKNNALIYYNKALAEAESTGNQQLINSLKGDISTINKQ